MTMDLNQTIQLAIDHAHKEFDESLFISDTLFPNQHRGVDLDGWALFTFVGDSVASSPVIVGVHMATGETKAMGEDDYEQ